MRAGGQHRKASGCSFAGVMVGALALAWVYCMVAMINSF